MIIMIPDLHSEYHFYSTNESFMIDLCSYFTKMRERICIKSLLESFTVLVSVLYIDCLWYLMHF